MSLSPLWQTSDKKRMLKRKKDTGPKIHGKEGYSNDAARNHDCNLQNKASNHKCSKAGTIRWLFIVSGRKNDPFERKVFVRTWYVWTDLDFYTWCLGLMLIFSKRAHPSRDGLRLRKRSRKNGWKLFCFSSGRTEIWYEGQNGAKWAQKCDMGKKLSVRVVGAFSDQIREKTSGAKKQA